MNLNCIRLALFLFISLHSYSTDTINLFKQKVLLLKNWELFFPENKLSLPGKVPEMFSKSSYLSTDSVPLNKFNGVCWFRKVFYTDSSFKNKTLTFNIEIIGAANIYLNGKSIAQLGIVGFSPESEYLINSSSELFSVNFEADKKYELVIRYSNHSLNESYNDKGENRFGFQISIQPTDHSFKEVCRNKLTNVSLGFIFFSFFTTLFFVHLVIFLFNKNQISNLYYSFFCLFIAVLIVAIFSRHLISSLNALRIIEMLVIICPVFIFLLLPVMLRSFFVMKRPRWYYGVFSLGLLTIILFIFPGDLHNILFMGLVLICCAETIRVLIVAIREKKQAVKIIGIGVLFFLLFISFIIISFYTVSNYHVEGGLFGLILFLFIILSIISIPVSITIFLAYQILQTNKSLSKKLIEVEELSAKSLEQEKEKQHILENQKATLELQVKERTHEITEQKKIIEEKNKDIIDSITYAKRIQSAMLPDENSFSSIFENAFVLYEPRDIVSGDFYYAANNSEGKLIIAADCTGHGVPGALMSMVGSNIVNKLVHENKLSGPKTILEHLHKELRHALKQDTEGSVNRDGMDVCAVLITEKEIKYAGANRPLIYFTKDYLLKEVKATKTPVGGSHIESINIEQHILSLENIQEIFLFSDGFADQFGGPEGKKLMVSRFKNWLQEIISLPVAQQKEILSQKFSGWKRQTEQVDDVMVIGIIISYCLLTFFFYQPSLQYNPRNAEN